MENAPPASLPPLDTDLTDVSDDYSPAAVVSTEVHDDAAAADAMCGCGEPAPASGRQDAAVVPRYIYAIGQLVPRFPSRDIEQEYAQVASRTETAGLTDQQAFSAVLSAPDNRYLARQMCYVFRVQGLDAYAMMPRDPGDLDLLVNAVRPDPKPSDLDVIIGLRGPLAPPALCNGLIVPIVVFDQLYSFDRDDLVSSIPRPKKSDAKQFGVAAAELLERIINLADNAGSTDEHRALNYMLVRDRGLYTHTVEQYERDFSLTGVEVRPPTVQGTRRQHKVILKYTNRANSFVEQFMAVVDTTGEFPFMAAPMTAYIDR